jgi:hypothetical protein
VFPIFISFVEEKMASASKRSDEELSDVKIGDFDSGDEAPKEPQRKKTHEKKKEYPLKDEFQKCRTVTVQDYFDMHTVPSKEKCNIRMLREACFHEVVRAFLLW